MAPAGFPETRASLVAKLRDPEDRHAWDEFVALYRPVVYRLARKRGLQDADAQDLAQAVMASLSVAVHRWRPDEERAKFRTWVARIAKNAIVNAATRGRHERGKGGSSVYELLAAQPDDDAEGNADFDFEERREIYRRAAAKVRMQFAADAWEAFTLSTVGGLSPEEAARKTGKSVGAVYATRSRIMRSLKEAVRQIAGES